MMKIEVMIGGAVLLLVLCGLCIETVSAGHVKVGTLFGEIDETVLQEGFHVVNPLKSWTEYDCREKTVKFDKVTVPAQDQQRLTMDISIQYRAIKEMAHVMKGETGTVEGVVEVHMVPKARSIIREAGKNFENIEDFFLGDNQRGMQEFILTNLSGFMTEKGIQVTGVLIRDIKPPAYITAAIEKKKVRQQKAEEQEAELKRFEVEQQQKVKTAEAEKAAAAEDAEKQKILADARAYEIEKINDAIAKNPAYIQLEAIKAMEAISKNPANQIYFIDSQSHSPLPLMHLGVDPKNK